MDTKKDTQFELPELLKEEVPLPLAPKLADPFVLEQLNEMYKRNGAKCCENCMNNPKNNPLATGTCFCAWPSMEMIRY